MDHFWLTDEQFAKIALHLPTDTRGKQRVDDRRVISGIVQVLRSGGRWADAPRETYGPKKTLYNCFVRWAELARGSRHAKHGGWPAEGAKGVWTGLFEALANAGGPPAQVLIDSSAVKAHRCASGGKGGSRARPSAAPAAVARPRSTRSPISSAGRSPSC